MYNVFHGQKPSHTEQNVQAKIEAKKKSPNKNNSRNCGNGKKFILDEVKEIVTEKNLQVIVLFYTDNTTKDFKNNF